MKQKHALTTQDSKTMFHEDSLFPFAFCQALQILRHQLDDGKKQKRRQRRRLLKEAYGMQCMYILRQTHCWYVVLAGSYLEF
jgi:hypothetical protein